MVVWWNAAAGDDFLFNIVTGYESCFYHFVLVMKWQHGIAVHDFKRDKGQNSTLGQRSYENCFLGWWAMRDVWWEAINVACCVQMLEKMRYAHCGKHPMKETMILQLGSIWPHAAYLVTEVITENAWDVCPCSPDSLGLSPADCHLQGLKRSHESPALEEWWQCRELCVAGCKLM